MRDVKIHLTHDQTLSILRVARNMKDDAKAKALNLQDKQLYRRLNALPSTNLQLEGVIGYLATYALPNDGEGFTTCEITCRSDGTRETPELLAVYSGAGNLKSVIGAIWHETHWGCHT